MKYFSRRNCVTASEGAVRKHFLSCEDWAHELRCLRMLDGHVRVPQVQKSLPGLLLLEHLDGHTLLQELETQEFSGFSPEPWQALALWLRDVHTRTGLVPADGNLRNYLWNPSAKTLAGIDLEHLTAEDLTEAAARLAAFLLEYHPADTPLKRQAAAILTGDFRIPPERVIAERASLLKRRADRKPDSLDEHVSFALLTGGRSSRMGRDKASLTLLGVSFEAHQLEKARMLGISDVLVGCGTSVPDAGNAEARYISDFLPDRGPLGGLHACLSQAKREHCIVLGVDTPLIPPSLLQDMVQAHLTGDADATLATHDGKYEPLIAVYRTGLAERILPLIRDGGAPVRALLRDIRLQLRTPDAPETIWRNCNTPESYSSLFEENPMT